MLEVKEFSLIEAFKTRQSIRTYTGSVTSDVHEKIAQIVQEANKVKGPFGTFASIDITGAGVGRIGFISNEAGWIVLKIPLEKNGAPDYVNFCIDAAFKANIAVMKLTQIGIGTCWVGGTYSQKECERRFPGFKIPCVVSFGFDHERRSMMDKLINLVKSSGRYDFSVIYFNEITQAPLQNADNNKLNEILECVRWSPSAVNRQSWRMNVNIPERKFKVFDYYNLSNSYSMFDIGIFISGIYLLTEGKCRFDVSPSDEKFHTGGKYVCTIYVEEGVF
ncbi:hypothetical protein TVAG_473580 [Trichomonas vaginalis G3]|uniref:Putative nitroreductase TM1586 domain-containing protein n=1 Tax=Trichomonas vaginalis (strain ATCC PRA-98 / G3) TaxID=412133 RepID=A2FN19_TRIV3|nr:putative TM nitroreductase family [Trichomonas vaginalis G3]EAX93690.1 hypothetical protein TVAG_473580 [Trichomonas vaginalis G3]KAI5549825.1 putative TM nitroreductase family [Trichomonas vaginalis G3]|eukprot:XP_001306620.1 hypothetical protein [Trichomonas vaginalis G3]